MRVLGVVVLLVGIAALAGGVWLRDAFAPVFVFPFVLLEASGAVLCLLGVALIVYGGG